MFLYHSNRLENLAARLCGLLNVDPPPPLTPDIIVVQHQGMAQWLKVQIAESEGIAANLSFPLPARFIGETASLFSADLQANDCLDRPVLRWLIYQVLPQVASLPACKDIAGYLSEKNQIKRYQLAGAISDVYDKYLVYRPDVIQKWENGEGSDWQAILWRHLLECSGAKTHRGNISFQIMKMLDAAEHEPAHLPRRCFLFGINSLAPVYLEILSRLSHFMEIHFFHLNPCEDYWGDLQSAKATAKSRNKDLRNQDSAALFAATGNPLLASWGKVGQDFHNQLFNYDLNEIDLYSSPTGTTLLRQVQTHILSNQDGTTDQNETLEFTREDRSIRFHICHSPLREIQVLHDQLLTMFEQIEGLKAGDILVTAPDISEYAEAVHTVFNGAPPELYIPYTLADQPAGKESATIQTFLDLLLLFQGRFTAPELLDLLETEALLHRFGLPRSSVVQIRQWVEDTAIRWGLTPGQQFAENISVCNQNSWQNGLDRLLLGYFTESAEQPFEGLYPCPVDSSEADTLGRFINLINQIKNRLPNFSRPHSRIHWTELLTDLLKAFFDRDSDEKGFELLTDAIYEFGEHTAKADLSEDLDLQVVCRHLTEQLTEKATGRVFLTGRTTFCNMVPMRAVPFKVICVLGMNDGAFPRSQQAASFDLTAQDPRIGDRNRRNDDRYLFLEIVTSARNVLHISWSGRNQHDDNITPPSILVSELQDYLDASFPEKEEPISRHLITQHPLQPFSPKSFAENSPARSYAGQWVPSMKKAAPPPFFTPRQLSTTDSEGTIDLNQLTRFWKNPVRYFLVHTLGLRLYDQTKRIETAEPFSLDSLQLYSLRRQTVEALMNDEGPEASQRMLTSGFLPHADFGSNLMEDITHEHSQLIDNFIQCAHTPQEPLEIDLPIGNRRLKGWLDNLYSTGRVTWRSGAVRGALLMELWVKHLVLNLAEPLSLPPVTTHIGKDQLLSLRPVSTPERYLKELIVFYEQGESCPLSFYPESSMAWNRAKPENRLRDASRVWIGGPWSRGESQDEAYRLLYRAPDIDQLNKEFQQLAELFTPIYDHLSNNHAAP